MLNIPIFHIFSIFLWCLPSQVGLGSQLSLGGVCVRREEKLSGGPSAGLARVKQSQSKSQLMEGKVGAVNSDAGVLLLLLLLISSIPTLNFKLQAQ